MTLLIQQLGKQASNLQYPFWKENVTQWIYYSLSFPFMYCKRCVTLYFWNKLLPLSALWKLVAHGTSLKLYSWGCRLRKLHCTSGKTFVKNCDSRIRAAACRCLYIWGSLIFPSMYWPIVLHLFRVLRFGSSLCSSLLNYKLAVISHRRWNQDPRLTGWRQYY